MSSFSSSRFTFRSFFTSLEDSLISLRLSVNPALISFFVSLSSVRNSEFQTGRKIYRFTVNKPMQAIPKINTIISNPFLFIFISSNYLVCPPTNVSLYFVFDLLLRSHNKEKLEALRPTKDLSSSRIKGWKLKNWLLFIRQYSRLGLKQRRQLHIFPS